MVICPVFVVKYLKADSYKKKINQYQKKGFD